MSVENMLTIGSTVCDDWIVTDSFRVTVSPKYDDSAEEFTSVYGEKRERFIGLDVSLSAELMTVPETTAKQIMIACRGGGGDGKAPITWNGASSGSGRLKVRSTAVTSFQGAERYYDINIDASGDILLDGL